MSIFDIFKRRQIPFSVANGYATSHRNLIVTIRNAMAEFYSRPQDIDEQSQSYGSLKSLESILLPILEEHQKSLDDAFQEYLRGNPSSIHSRAIMDLSLSKAMDDYDFRWATIEYQKAIDQAVDDVCTFSGEIYDIYS
jgi:hypothetical protein